MDEYPPGWDADALAVLRRRTAGERAAFALRALAPGSRIVDVGCGPGTITAGLAAATGPGGRVLGIDHVRHQVAAARALGIPWSGFAVGSAYALPVAGRSVDLVFAHALMEHLARPDLALAQFRRVLRAGGLVALSSSDWGAARVTPRDRDVHRALAAYVGLRRRAGGDPCAGGRLAWWVRRAGLTDVRVRTHHRVDMGYVELARYIGARLQRAAGRATSPGDRAELFAAAQAAARWSTRGDGEEPGRVEQCWVEVTARS